MMHLVRRTAHPCAAGDLRRSWGEKRDGRSDRQHTGPQPPIGSKVSHHDVEV